MLLRAADALLAGSVPAANILYATFDHPILKRAGIHAVIDAWREPRAEGPEYPLLDEAQVIRDWGTWVKHQVDFRKDRRIAFTGSAMPLVEVDQESGVGRRHSIRLTTLSFCEYLQVKRLHRPELPKLRSLREDIIDKVLKRDMTALFGVRRVLGLEHTFLYLCLQDGGLLHTVDLCSNLEVKRPTAQHFIELLGATHLIYRLAPYGYVVTKSLDDVGPMQGLPVAAPDAPAVATQIMLIPAPLLCYGTGASELPTEAG